jgi:CRP-like cAMP-binding protein
MAKIRALRKCRLFRSLGFRDLAILAHHVDEGSIPAEKWLVEEGGPSDGLVIIKSGKVIISMSSKGSETLEMGPGEFFGELSVLHGAKTRAVGAMSVDRCEFLKLQAAAFGKLQVEAPEVAGKIAQGILEAMAEKMSATQAYLRELVSGPREA